MNELDKFFATHDFTSDTELLSHCCGAKPHGELFRNFGRCADCLEMTEFTKQED